MMCTSYLHWIIEAIPTKIRSVKGTILGILQNYLCYIGVEIFENVTHFGFSVMKEIFSKNQVLYTPTYNCK